MPFDLSTIASVLYTSLFTASYLFLIAIGLQIIFGVQKILNLAVGSFYALGLYFGVTALSYVSGAESPLVLVILPIAGLAVAFLGPILERGVIKFLYGREIVYTLLATFAIFYMFEDVMKSIWGINPIITKISLSETFGSLNVAGHSFPFYYIYVIAFSFGLAGLLNYIFYNTSIGIKMRAVTDDRDMSRVFGVDVGKIFILTFTIGLATTSLGGCLMAPITAAQIGIGAEIIVPAFAIVVISGLGTMKGTLYGSLIVGFLKTITMFTYPKLEVIVIYVAVTIVLLLRPEGLFGE